MTIQRETSIAEWDELFHGRPPACRLWREFCDALNQRFIADNLPREGWHGPVLKTDAYEEVHGRGLLPSIIHATPLAIGTDIAPAPVRQLREKIPEVSTLQSDVRALPFRHESLAAVVSTSTLDHFTHTEHIAQAFREIHATLKNGGLLYLTLDNPQNPLLWLRARIPLSFLRKTGLVPYFVGATLEQREIERQLTRLGFDILHRDHLMHVPRVLAIPLCRLASWLPGTWAPKALFAMLEGCERIPGKRLRAWTGHYSGIVAVRRRKA